MPAALAIVGALVASPVIGAVAADGLVFTRAEVAAGRAPRTTDEPPEPTVVVQLEPGAGFSLRTERSNFEMLAGPRFYFRKPNLGDVDRPLVLMQATARHDYALDARLTWLTRGSIQYGEVEYSGADVVLNSPLARPTEDAVLSTVYTTGDTGFQWQTTRRYQLSVTGLISYTHPLKEADQRTYPTTIGYGGDVNQRFELNPRGTLYFPTSGRYYSINLDPDWYSVSQSVGYLYRASARTTWDVMGGAIAAWEVGDPVQVFPRARFGWEQIVHQSRTSVATNRLTATMDGSFDQILGRLYPVIGLQEALTVRYGPRWTVIVTGAAYTAATREPVDLEGQDTSLDGSASALHTINDNIGIEFGIRASTRASHWSISPVDWSAGEQWAFCRATFQYGTGPLAAQAR